MNKIILLLLLLLSSCASARPTVWYVKDVAAEKRRWRYCHVAKDGPEKHEKGICYISMKCRKTWIRTEKCKADPLFCAWGDVVCLHTHKWPTVLKGGTR